MFSPIAQRSFSVRLLYLVTYSLLILGAVTMVAPFLVMLTGSVDPGSSAKYSFFPSYFVSREAMWEKYLEAKYQEIPDLLRMSWSRSQVSFDAAPAVEPKTEEVERWNEFLDEVYPARSLFMLGFLRPTPRMPSYSARVFRTWLLAQFDNDLDRLNSELGTQYPKATMIQPPNLGLIGAAPAQSKFMDKFNEFCATLPRELFVPWDVGGYYRSVFLPTTVGDISAFNRKQGTSFQSYEEVPFPSEISGEGKSDWTFFVTKVLRSDFVRLTESGEAARQALGIEQQEFIRTKATGDDVRVISLDTLYGDWALRTRGIPNAKIPQAMLDYSDFTQREMFWKWQFIVMNYQRVLDEVLLHGRAILNTVILVVLMVGGSLIVNPLAAYALSRYKMRKTYHILLFCLATIAFPAEVTMIPVFLQLKEMSLLNTFGALVLPGLANGFSIFLLKGFFDSLPKELYEAAQIDGASEWTMFWQITMYLSKPILAVIALGAFASAYGTFFYALILAPDPAIWTIMVYIYQLRSEVDTPVVFASLVITAIPTLLVFIFCQNIILRGIVVPSDK